MRSTLDRQVQQRSTAAIAMALSLAPSATVFWLERMLDLPNAFANSLWLTSAAPALVGAVLAVQYALQRGGRPATVLAGVHSLQARAGSHDRAA